MEQQDIRIKLKGFDYRLVDQAAKEITETVKRAGAQIKGPIPLPTKKEKFTILVSPHVNKDARDQYELKTHKRLLEIIAPSEKTVNSLMRLDLAVGIEVNLELVKTDDAKELSKDGVKSPQSAKTPITAKKSTKVSSAVKAKGDTEVKSAPKKASADKKKAPVKKAPAKKAPVKKEEQELKKS